VSRVSIRRHPVDLELRGESMFCVGVNVEDLENAGEQPPLFIAST
jgi:hypothetical protein